MIALFVWWDVLRCLPDHMGDLKENKVDLKKLYHKPLIYFVLSLRLYYDLPTIEDTLTLAVKKKLLPDSLLDSSNEIYSKTACNKTFNGRKTR